MLTDPLRERFQDRPDEPAIIAPGGRCTFAELSELCRHWDGEIERDGIQPGAVVALRGDFSPNSIALFIALLDRSAVIVPESSDSRFRHTNRDEIAQVEGRYLVDEEDRVRFERTGLSASHDLYEELRRRDHPGLVVFSSGTSGEPKAAVHDAALLLGALPTHRRGLSMFTFLLFDHLGGVRTMFQALTDTVTMAATRDRSPEVVCALIEEHRIELLPATPTFFNLMLLSGAHRRHDLSSLRVISYGAEPMPQSTLDRLHEAFPDVKLQQTYGLIEIGPLSSRSRDDGSLWMKVGGDTRVVDGILQIRHPVMMLGYLNASAPITSDGWFVTGDAVIQEGEYIRVLGRKSELINVGGEKVSPVEVESVIQSMPGVEEATVYGESHRLVGQIVCAKVRAPEVEDEVEFARQVKRFCRERLDRVKVPVKVKMVEERQFGERFKKLRQQG